jgi:hypothetical protein
MSEVDQHEFFSTYCEAREKDMTQPIVKPRTKGKTKKGGKQMTVTTEQFNILKQLGLV